MRSRVLTAIGLIPFVLGTFFCASIWPLLLLAGVVAILCALELQTLLKRPSPSFGALYGVLMCLIVAPGPISALAPPNAGLGFGLGGALIGVAAVLYASRLAKDSVVKWILADLVSVLWFMMPLWCLLELHKMIPHGSSWVFANPILMAVVPLWGGDTAAIFAGKAFGKHPLAPKISPKKTVEGGIANLLACCLVALPLGTWIGYSWPVSLACGAAAGIFGQVGDLFESYVKRQAGVKDSGSLLPGHGGLLDRIDSVLFTAPIVYAILTFFKLQ